MQFVDAYQNFTTIPAPKRANVSVPDLLPAVVALVRPDAHRLHIEITITDSAPPLRIFADATQLDMVLLNLIRNAMDSLTDCPTPTITIASHTDRGRVCITVSDNGPGIEPEALEKVFIPFFTTKTTGSGIGLSLSRQIMQAHGGQLRAGSVVGAGSTFTLVFS